MKQSASLNQTQLFSLILERLVTIEVRATTIYIELANLRAEITNSDVEEVLDQFGQTESDVLKSIHAKLASEYGMMPEGLTSARVRKDLGLDDQQGAV